MTVRRLYLGCTVCKQVQSLVSFHVFGRLEQIIGSLRAHMLVCRIMSHSGVSWREPDRGQLSPIVVDGRNERRLYAGTATLSRPNEC